MNKTICVVTGSRADYGLLKKLMHLIKSDPEIKLQIIVTGSHLSSSYGNTYKEIELDGFEIDHKISILDGFLNGVQTIEAMSTCQFEIAKIIDLNKPDLIIVLGDRYEILSAVISALILRVPVAHIHGGEITQGAFDDSIRHAITKLSNLHFVSTERNKQRVIQMGENPENVYHVGGLGVDAIKEMDFAEKSELEKIIGIKFGKKNLVVTFHPETNSEISPERQIKELLDALSVMEDINLIFTGVNADPGSQKITEAINYFISNRTNAVLVPSLGQKNYFSTILYSDGVIGNSSSGLLEVPSLKKATINIGNRQYGRETSDSVINSPCSRDQIVNAINMLYSPDFKFNIEKTSNPYEKDNSAAEIYKVLKQIDLKSILPKKFHEL